MCMWPWRTQIGCKEVKEPQERDPEDTDLFPFESQRLNHKAGTLSIRCLSQKQASSLLQRAARENTDCPVKFECETNKKSMLYVDMRPVHFGETCVKQSIHGLFENTIQVEFHWPSWFLPSNPGIPAPQKLTSQFQQCHIVSEEGTIYLPQRQQGDAGTLYFLCHLLHGGTALPSECETHFRGVVLQHGVRALCQMSMSVEGSCSENSGAKHNAMFHSNDMGQATCVCFKIHFLDMFLRGPKHYLELSSHTKQHPVP